LKKAAIFALLSFVLVVGTVTVFPSHVACNGQSIDRPTASGTRLCRLRWPLGQNELAHHSVAPGDHNTHPS
jgi:hypothetical protein